MAFGPADVPRLAQANVDGPVLAFAGTLTLACGLVFGLAPALRMASRFPHEALKEGGRTGAAAGRDRLRSALVVGEIALALVLLTGAGLLIRSAVALDGVDPGFDPRDVVVGRISLPAVAYPTPEKVSAAFGRMAEALESTPGVEVAAMVSAAPLEGGGSNGLLPEETSARICLRDRLRSSSGHPVLFQDHADSDPSRAGVYEAGRPRCTEGDDHQ